MPTTSTAYTGIHLFSLGNSPPIICKQLAQQGRRKLDRMASGFKPAYNRAEALRNVCCRFCLQLSSLPAAILRVSRVSVHSPSLGPSNSSTQHSQLTHKPSALLLFTRGWVSNSYRAQTLRQEKRFLMLPLMIPLVNSGMGLIFSWESYTFSWPLARLLENKGFERNYRRGIFTLTEIPEWKAIYYSISLEVFSSGITKRLLRHLNICLNTFRKIIHIYFQCHIPHTWFSNNSYL